MKNKPSTKQLNFVQLSRIAYIDKELATGNFPSAKLLADQYQVSTKSIQRTVDFMKTTFNAPIVFDRKFKGYYYSEKNFRLNLLSLNEKDLYTLALMQKALDQTSGPFKKDISGLYNKLYYLYSDRIGIHLSDIDDVISFRIRSSRNIDQKIFEDLKYSAKNYTSVNSYYLTGYTGKLSQRLLDPYQIINEKGEWYLVAYCHKDKDIRTFSISRFKKTETTINRFERKKNFNVNKYFENSFGIFESDKIFSVKLYFDKDAARYVKEKVWHSSQKLKEFPDGSIILTMKLNSLVEVKFWVLSWGKSCKALAPKKLKESLKEELMKALINYK